MNGFSHPERSDGEAGAQSKDLPREIGRLPGLEPFHLRELDIEQQAALLPVICAALDEGKMTYDADQAHNRVQLQIKGPEVGYSCLLLANESTQIVVCYMGPLLWVPEAARAAMCEAVARANYALPIGNFELDVRDGELRFKASIDVEGGELVPTMVHNLINTGFNLCNLYHPAFMRIIYGGVTPEEAIAEVESCALPRRDIMQKYSVGRNIFVLLVTLTAASCSDRTPLSTERLPGEHEVERGREFTDLSCSAHVLTREVVCESPLTTLDRDVRASRIVGGQGLYLRLASTGVGYDSDAEVFFADVSIENLLDQPLR